MCCGAAGAATSQWVNNWLEKIFPVTALLILWFAVWFLGVYGSSFRTGGLLRASNLSEEQMEILTADAVFLTLVWSFEGFVWGG